MIVVEIRQNCVVIVEISFFVQIESILFDLFNQLILLSREYFLDGQTAHAKLMILNLIFSRVQRACRHRGHRDEYYFVLSD